MVFVGHFWKKIAIQGKIFKRHLTGRLIGIVGDDANKINVPGMSKHLITLFSMYCTRCV